MEQVFVFDDYEFLQNGEVTFRYIISGVEEIVFTEKLTFPHGDFTLIPEPLRHRLLMNLHLIFGISYWKLYCPKKIKIKNNQLTKEQADFWNVVYTKGLGEFFYRNNINFKGLIEFPYTNGTNAEPVVFERQNRSLLMLGGGKDSIVAGELLKEKKKEFSAFVVNDYSLQKEVVQLLNVGEIIVKRTVDPKLFDFNKRPGTYNGHVPISAVYAFIGLLTAILFDYRFIISSNEASANYGNVEYLGERINHQWSKSEEFEKLFQNYVKTYITPDVFYFSLLRHYYEIKIAQLFSQYPKYFPVFSSCNKNFRIQEKNKTKWCGECPKCAFIFVTLGAFLSKETLINIFGKNLFGDETLIDLYKELLGIKNVKPFECVGTSDEVKLAFYLVYKKKEFTSEVVMRMFEKEVLPNMKNIDQLKKDLLSDKNLPL